MTKLSGWLRHWLHQKSALNDMNRTSICKNINSVNANIKKALSWRNRTSTFYFNQMLWLEDKPARRFQSLVFCLVLEIFMHPLKLMQFKADLWCHPFTKQRISLKKAGRIYAILHEYTFTSYITILVLNLNTFCVSVLKLFLVL